MFPPLSQFTDLRLLLLRLMVAAIPHEGRKEEGGRRSIPSQQGCYAALGPMTKEMSMA